MYKRAYGKINIILKVYKKEEKEVKHKVDTAIQICKKIYDKIKIKESDNFEVVYTNKYKQKLSFNDCSVNKVVNWFKKNFPDSNTNFKIKIIKKIPPNSGFGGESTDAAFVLNYLLSKNNVYELTKTQLRDLALNVGSDIPFFLSKLEQVIKEKISWCISSEVWKYKIQVKRSPNGLLKMILEKQKLETLLEEPVLMNT